MGSTLSTRLDASELRELQNSTAFTRDELLELYAQFRFLSDNQKTITRAQFELGLASVGIGPAASHTPSLASRQQSLAHQQHSSGDHAPGGESDIPTIEFIRAPTDAELSVLSKVEHLVFRLYDVLYAQAHDEPAPTDPAADKGLSFDDFCAALSTLVSPKPEEQIESIFRLFDESGDDYITQDELARALCAVSALLELPELSTDRNDDVKQTRARAREFAADIVRKYGSGGKLTLPQFRMAVASHPALADIGKQLVQDACADFFHVNQANGGGKTPTVKSPATGALDISNIQRTTSGSGLLTPNGEGPGSRPRSPLSRRGSFLAAPANAPAYFYAREADQVEAEDAKPSSTPTPTTASPSTAQPAQPPLNRCSLSHVIVHTFPRETKQQIAFVAQRHRAEFRHRTSDRYMHLVLVERPTDADAVTPAELAEMQHEFRRICGGGSDKSPRDPLQSRIHVAVKPVAVKYPKEGVKDDTFVDTLCRFLDANPSNVVRLPYALGGSATAELTTKFSDLALMVGHGFAMVTPETAPTAVVRRMRNFIFCAEKSRASERAARLLGTMMNHKHRDMCVVETLWSVSLSSIGHAIDDTDDRWRAHLRTLRERSLKVAEHFKTKVAHGAAWAATAEALGVDQSEMRKDDPKAAREFPEHYDAAVHSIAVGAAEEKEWDASIVKMLQRAGLVKHGADMVKAGNTPPRSETVFVVGFQSRTMAKKFYAETMAYLCHSAHSMDAARQSVSFIFVN
mmetsp:Transcript_19071/g.59208  ORF Transcript_19071/g.59208 Transcript_19071/m.59208 type:complete len:744 (-) Transcript_19071:127-2358(-)|eukprot:CAMPEP_0174855580 /NCGR_PEP_ID=MMETSP1114-20130205/33604_1 /TAXON_ID=312471 /ORGANISM="Neobodo designis, Strain CCAP 1951/1" /LENGTH=743 /DNA_ID=CAMNT_0016090321 /DNA_START=66 /DNA_END=2297 /DNA_ORIENTATION=+